MAIPTEKGTRYFRTKGIPTTFEDGLTGTTILMEDVTSERVHLKNLEFLARTSAAFANMRDDEDIYQFIVNNLQEIIPGSITIVNSIDLESRISRCEAMGDTEHIHEQVARDLGVRLIGISLNIDNVPEAPPALQRNVLVEGLGRLYVQAYRKFPKKVCDEIDKKYALGKDYTMGCVCRGGLYGNVTIRLKKGADISNKETIEAPGRCRDAEKIYEEKASGDRGTVEENRFFIHVGIMSLVSQGIPIQYMRGHFWNISADRKKVSRAVIISSS
ncbi:MAG: hypothetical protein LUQ17_01155 [Methanomicrobiales archaeon]|nr:hypothetical protein [Methanomicrobiales archaeon]